MCLIPELAPFGLSHRCLPWLHPVPSIKLLWGERAHLVAGPGCVRCLQCPAGALGCTAARAWLGSGAGLQGGMGRGWQGCRWGTRAGATSGIAGRHLEHGEEAECGPGGHSTPSRLEEVSHQTQLLSSCKEQQVAG